MKPWRHCCIPDQRRVATSDRGGGESSAEGCIRMFRFLVRRVLQMILTFFGATFIVYALMFANQTDPLQALAGERPLTESQRQVLTERYHLDEPFLGQYWYYMKGLLTGDFGQSLT